METNVFIFLTLVVFTQAEIDSVFDEMLDEANSDEWDAVRLPNKTGEFVRLQYDMVIPKEQFQQIVSRDDGREKRASVKMNRLWSRIIPYEIDETFDTSTKHEIVLAVQHTMQHTCIDFKEHEDEDNYIRFVNAKVGCMSFVGMSGGRQNIALSHMCIKKPLIVHEIGHLLGLFHEHLRSDRDSYVRVNYQNIMPFGLNQFYKLGKGEYTDYGKPYDYRSVMHFGKRYFGKKGNGNHRSITMETLDERYTDVIGNAPGLSFYDIMGLNSMYKCAAGCKPKKCNEDEFLGKNCECYCMGPPEYAAVPCARDGSCSIPFALSSGEYCFFNLDSMMDMNTTDKVRHGHRVEVSYCDIVSCGYVTSTIKCNNSIWEGNTSLSCVTEMCEVDAGWEDEYFVDHQFDFVRNGTTKNIVHGTEVFLYCPDNSSITNILRCSNGRWQGQLLKCTGKECKVNYKPGDDFVYTLYGQPLYDDQTVEHGSEVGVKCKFGDDVGISASNVTCIDGKWTWATPSRCPPDCSDGKEHWQDFSSYRFTNGEFRVAITGFKLCRRSCVAQPLFVCTGVSYGYNEETREFECFHHRISKENPEKRKKKRKWTASKRACLNRSK